MLQQCTKIVYEAVKNNIDTIPFYSETPNIFPRRYRFDREAAMRQESGMGRMWVNPYKSLVPQVGYYDINVLLEALKLKECHVSLHAVFNPKV